MHYVLIRYKDPRDSQERDVAVARDQPRASQYVDTIKKLYPSYQRGEFTYKRVKLIK